MHEYRNFLREFEEFRIRSRHFFEDAHLAATGGEPAGAATAVQSLAGAVQPGAAA